MKTWIFWRALNGIYPFPLNIIKKCLNRDKNRTTRACVNEAQFTYLNKTILKKEFNINWKYWMDSQLLYFKDVFLNTRSLWNKNLAAIPIYYLSRSAWLSCLSIIIWLITSITNYGHDHEIIIRKVLLNVLNINVAWFQQFVKLQILFLFATIT